MFKLLACFMHGSSNKQPPRGQGAIPKQNPAGGANQTVSNRHSDGFQYLK